jgi:hypothetical protein
MTFEEQLIASWVLKPEGDERPQELPHCRARLARDAESFESLEKLTIAVGKHRVIERVLRIEVFIEGGLAHPHLAGERVQRDPCDAVLPGEPPRSGDDQGNLGFAALGDLVRHQFTLSVFDPITNRYFTY